MIFATGHIYRETGTGQENETDDGNVRIYAEVELQPKTRDRKASRNSWADIYNENTTLRKHKMLLGQEVETDDGLEWRVKWGQRGAGVSCFACTDMLGCKTDIVAIVFGAIATYIFWYIVLQKRLVRDCETIVARDERGDYSRISSVQLEY